MKAIERAIVETRGNDQSIRYRVEWSWFDYIGQDEARYADEVVIVSEEVMEEVKRELAIYEANLQLDIDWRMRQRGWEKLIAPSTGEAISCAMGRSDEYERRADDGTPICFFPTRKFKPDWRRAIVWKS